MWCDREVVCGGVSEKRGSDVLEENLCMEVCKRAGVCDMLNGIRYEEEYRCAVDRCEESVRDRQVFR